VCVCACDYEGKKENEIMCMCVEECVCSFACLCLCLEEFVCVYVCIMGGRKGVREALRLSVLLCPWVGMCALVFLGVFLGVAQQQYMVVRGEDILGTRTLFPLPGNAARGECRR
jgi:hypothetical protein